MKWISCKDKLPQKSGYHYTLVFCRDGIIRTAVMKYEHRCGDRNSDGKYFKYGVWSIKKNSSLILKYNYENKFYSYAPKQNILSVIYWSELDLKEEDWISVEDKLPSQSGYYIVKTLFQNGNTRIGFTLFLKDFNGPNSQFVFFNSTNCNVSTLSYSYPSFFLSKDNYHGSYLLDKNDKIYKNAYKVRDGFTKKVTHWSVIPEPVFLSEEDSIRNNNIIFNLITTSSLS